MRTGEGAFKKAGDGYWYAVVRVAVDDDTTAPRVKVHCSGEGFELQGYAYELAADGDEVWKDAAVAGAQYALSHTGRSNSSITILEIKVLPTDTCTAAVAGAAAIAVWDALSFQLPVERRALIDKVVADCPRDEIPDFGRVWGALLGRREERDS